MQAYAISGFAIALIAAYLGSGFYVVGADERAVVRRFGAVAEHVGPGMHYRLPWPVDRADVVKTTTVMQTGVGFILERASGSSSATGMELLTGDTNILSIALVLQFNGRLHHPEIISQMQRARWLYAREDSHRAKE